MLRPYAHGHVSAPFHLKYGYAYGVHRDGCEYEHEQPSDEYAIFHCCFLHLAKIVD